MKSLFNKGSLVLFFLLFTTTLISQNIITDVAFSSFPGNIFYDDDVSFYDGMIELNNNDTLYGRISINHTKNGTFYTLIKSDSIYTEITNNEIIKVALNSKNSTETEFMAIDDEKRLYRKVFKNENGVIYDTSNKPFDGRLVGEVFVDASGKNVVNTYNFWSSSPKKDLINYFSKRDKIKYKRKYFRTLEDLFLIL